MKTVIDNNQRVFQIVTSLSHQYFCNLSDIPTLIQVLELREGYHKIYHFWNNKPKIASKKYLNQMFEANKITFKIK